LYFYTSELATEWLVLAVATALTVAVLTRAKVWYTPFYLLLGALLWYATFRSGIHATIAGVAMGLLAPAKSLLELGEAPPIDMEEMDAHHLRTAKFRLNESVSVAARLEHQLHPFTSFFIVPVFALANAGIELNGDALSDALTSPITLGVVLGLVVGKVVGISLFTMGAVRLGLSSLPAGATVRHVVGISAIAGIGFTVSLFVTGLAYDAPVLQDEAKVGILFASVVAAVMGVAVLSGARAIGTGGGTEVRDPEPGAAADHGVDDRQGP